MHDDPLLPHIDLRAIVAAASTITERYHGDMIASELSSNEQVLRQHRFDAWCKITADGDMQRFQEVLSWDGYDTTKVQAVLGHVQLNEQIALPGWAIILQEVLHTTRTTPCIHGIIDKSSWTFLKPDQPFPFEEILSPFVIVAQRRYVEQAGYTYPLLTAEAHHTMQRDLLQVLTSLAINTLQAALLHQRSLYQESSTKQVAQPSIDDTAEYRQFTDWMYQGGLAAFFHTYSYQARLLATTTDRWIESTIEFLQRLEADTQEIQHTFGGNSEREQVIALEPALSDPHNGRRSVLALTFASGMKLVYKPRAIGMEVSYYNLLNWCNEHGATPPFKILATIDRSTYGWVEYVAYESCQDMQAIQRYYQRSGMLLCLVYLCGGVGCSYASIIAHSEHPILIDPTNLLHHYPCPDHQHKSSEKQCADWEQQQFSVLHTGLLASWQMSMPSTHFRPGRDISGIAINDTRKQPQAQFSQSIVALKYGMLRSHEHINVPTYNDQAYLPAEYHEAICHGFSQLYQLMLSQRHALLAIDSPLRAFKHLVVRVIYRASQVYHTHIAKLLAPEYMYDGVTYNIELERLWQEHIPIEYKSWHTGNSARWRQVYLAEQQALLQGDVPFLTAHTDSAVLLADTEITSCLHEPTFDLLLKQLQQLSVHDMHSQTGLIQRALKTGATPVVLTSISEISIHTIHTNEKLPDNKILLAHALAIADSLAAQAIDLGSDAITWIQPAFLMHSHRYQLLPLRYSIFNGSSGIAFFLAATARISGDERYSRLAKAAVRQLCQSLQTEGELVTREMGIGGAVGLGSLVYALTYISHFLDDPGLRIAASQAAHLINARHIANDQALDVIAGSAGAILGLLALYDVSHDDKILAKAVLCGNHLLQTRTMSKAGCLAWPTLSQRHITGFSHGTAGIAYALLRLYAITCDKRLLNAAREGLIYEEHAFMGKVGNWARFLTNEQPTYMTTWCHGAPGIALARIGGLSMLDSAQIRQEIDVALNTTQLVGTQGHDHLCCGNSGRAEILLTAAQKLTRPELAAVAKHHMWSMVTRAEQQGIFFLEAELPNWVPIIDLFRGISGIGYTLLRMTYPEQLPSVLLWE